MEKEKNKERQELPVDTSPLFKSILENSKVAGIFIMNKNGTILRANPGALQYFGYAEEDVVGENFSLLFTREDKSKSSPEKELKTVIETGSGKDDNYVVHKNGRLIWCHGESVLATDEKGNIFIVKIVYDIDTQKRLEQRLLKINNDLSNFVYTASHDLRSPINNIEGLIESFSTHDDIVKTYGEEIRMIKDSILIFKNMLQDLSQIGRAMEEGNEHITEIGFKEIFEEVKFNLRKEIEIRHAKLTDDFSKAPELKYARKNLRSILFNLLSNALKFSSPDRRPEIIISTEVMDFEWILLKVKDNGVGIKEEDKRNVFSMYKRLQPNIDGTGVGMTIVARIVDSNGGKIEIESEPGKGSTFKIYFKKE
jgi:PAS domain S-box-containing protein